MFLFGLLLGIASTITVQILFWPKIRAWAALKEAQAKAKAAQIAQKLGEKL